MSKKIILKNHGVFSFFVLLLLIALFGVTMLLFSGYPHLRCECPCISREIRYPPHSGGGASFKE
jgi:hypothetical protein